MKNYQKKILQNLKEMSDEVDGYLKQIQVNEKLERCYWKFKRNTKKFENILQKFAKKF